MFEAQVKVQLTRLGSTYPSLAVGRTSFACGARRLQTVPTTENWTGAPVWGRYVPRRNGATQAAKPVPMRFANGQQNAYRRDPSGGDPGGCPARQSRRRIRL